MHEYIFLNDSNLHYQLTLVVGAVCCIATLMHTLYTTHKLDQHTYIVSHTTHTHSYFCTNNGDCSIRIAVFGIFPSITYVVMLDAFSYLFIVLKIMLQQVPS